jgi:hypothetical protein
MNKRLLIIFALLIAMPFMVKLYLAQRNQVQVLSCGDITKGCGNELLNVRFEESPKTMKPLHLNLHLSEPESIGDIHIDFAMQKMEMGLNRYLLIPSKETGDWQAEVTLPVCIQGRSLWNMLIEIEKKGDVQRFQVPFSANPGRSD